MQKIKSVHNWILEGLFLLLFIILFFPATAFSQNKKGIEELIRDLKAEKSLTRRNAAEQLGSAKDARGVEPLIETLRDDDEGVRKEAATTLGQIGNARAVKPLGDVLDDTDEFVRLNALAALELIGSDEAVDLIIAALKNENPLVRANAAISLGRIGNKKGVTPLEELAKNETLSYVRFAAEQGLAQIKGEANIRVSEKPMQRVITSGAREIPSLVELEQAAERIKEQYSLMLDYKKYDIMELLDIESRMRMRHPRDTIDSLLGNLLTKEDKERNRHLFEPKQ